MNSLGNYKPKMVRGVPTIDPERFILDNWPLLCQIAKIDPVPGVTVISGKKPSFLSGSDTAAMFYRSDTEEIVLNCTDLQTDAERMIVFGLNLVALLWAIPATMVRTTLFHRGLIDASDRLEMIVARVANWPKDLQTLLYATIGCKVGTDEFRRRCDVLLIQMVVQNYMQTLSFYEEVDCNKLHNILWAKKSDLNIELFKIQS